MAYIVQQANTKIARYLYMYVVVYTHGYPGYVLYT
jgi:hypothetical protein